MQDEIIVIGDWDNEQSTSLRLQDFVSGGESFIPIFSDEQQFRRQVRGSGFEGKGVAIDRNLLHSLLRGDELLILNPGDSNPVRMRKADIA